MTDPHRVYFTNKDRMCANLMVDSRCGFKRNAGVPSDRRSNMTDEQIDYYGALGEIALAKCLGLTIVIDSYLGGDGGVDFEFCGLILQAKYTRYFDGRLIYALDKIDQIIAAYYFLSTGTDRYADMLGYTDRKTFLFNGHVGDLGHGPTFILERSFMHPFDEFLEKYHYALNGVNERESVSYIFFDSNYQEQ